MLREVQRVYRLQGVDINDKHIEIIVRQMLKKVRIEDNGDSSYLPGTLVDVLDFEDTNEKLIAEGKQPAEGSQVMLGITKKHRLQRIPLCQQHPSRRQRRFLQMRQSRARLTR